MGLNIKLYVYDRFRRESGGEDKLTIDFVNI